MHQFFRGLGYVCLGLLAIIALFAWYVVNEASLRGGAIGLLCVGAVYWIIQDFIVKPIRAEFRELHRRLDEIEGRKPAPSPFG